jgi:adenylate kinase family enzyme/nucleoside diphosphate kinase
MLGLEEKERTVVILKPEITLGSNTEAILKVFQSAYFDVKKRKQVYMTKSDAEEFFAPLKSEPAEFNKCVEQVLRGPCEVVVIETLDGGVVDKVLDFVRMQLEPPPEDVVPVPGEEEMDTLLSLGVLESQLYCSGDTWQAVRDLEFFFPCLDQLPTERTLSIVKPQYQQTDTDIMTVVETEAIQSGLLVVAKKSVVVTEEMAKVLYPDSPDLQASVMSDAGVVAMVLEGPGAVYRWGLLCGPSDPKNAARVAPTTLRARYGIDACNNAIHCSMTLEGATTELSAIVGASLSVQRTLCILKPDALSHLMSIKKQLEDAGFSVMRQEQIQLTQVRAEEFYRDHADESYFNSMVKYVTSGPVVVMVLCRLEAVACLNQLLGPDNGKDARKMFPNSIRAKFGKDGIRNAVHGSENLKAAQREVGFFFPEMGADPYPEDDEVKDFLFRKSAIASMDIDSISEPDPTGITIEPSLQQFISRGLMALCQVQPKGMDAVRWLSRWMMENSPNDPIVVEPDEVTFPDSVTMPTGAKAPEVIATSSGMMTVSAPPAAPATPSARKQVIEVDVSEETDETKVNEFTSPPFVVFVLGGPGCGKGTQCAKLREEFRMVHLSSGDLLREEVAARTQLGTEIEAAMKKGKLVPDDVTMRLLKRAMLKHQDCNRFLLDGFPRSIEQAKMFEMDLADVAFVLFFEASDDLLTERIMFRAKSQPGRPDDNPEVIRERLEVFHSQTQPVANYYGSIGKLRKVKASSGVNEVYSLAKSHFTCRFLYLMGPPGSQVPAIAGKLEEQYGYSKIVVSDILEQYANSNAKDAATVKAALAKGKAVGPSIACPLVLEEIYRDMATGINNFVICDFPQSLDQMKFLELRIPCTSRAILLDFDRSDASDLDTYFVDSGSRDMRDAKMTMYYSSENQEMIKKLPFVTRVPCNLSVLTSKVPSKPGAALKDRLVNDVWSSVKTTIMPSVTIVLGAPCSGTEILAPMLAARAPNSYAVDVDQLLDKELERKTEAGVMMHNVLAKGQVVPLAMTTHLLKSVINLTSSQSLVVENFPTHVDQIDYIQKDFKIDRVFSINAASQALQSMQEQFTKKRSGKTQSESGAAKAFDEAVKRLEPITSHFASQGKLERLDVAEKPKERNLEELVESVLKPKFAAVIGMKYAGTTPHAQALADSFDASPPAKIEDIVLFAKSQMSMDVDVNESTEFLKALQKYTSSRSSSIIVLDGYPANAEQAAAFTAKFGEPTILADVNLPQDQMMANAENEATAAGEENFDGEAVEAEIAEAKPIYDALQEYFAKTSCYIKVDGTRSVPDCNADIVKTLNPKAYIVISPLTAANVGRHVGAAMCSVSKLQDKQPVKFTLLDTEVLCKKGGHSQEIEEELTTVGMTASSADALPVPLWTDIIKEAVQRSPNPLGNFVISNFPTACSTKSYPSVRDQFDILESLFTLQGIIFVNFTEDAYLKFGIDEASKQECQDYMKKVEEYIDVQYGKVETVSVFKPELDGASASDSQGALRITCKKIATEFFKSEKA